MTAILALAVALPAGANHSDGQRAFITALKGGNEVPAVETDGFGVSVMRLNRAETRLSFALITVHLEDIHMAHIHCGAAGENGPVVAFLFGPANPMVTKNGLLSSGTLTDANVIPRSEGSPPLSCPTVVNDLADVIALIREGDAYVNVHTMDNPGGEIRGQLP
jgi:hypothetical protein